MSSFTLEKVFNIFNKLDQSITDVYDFKQDNNDLGRYIKEGSSESRLKFIKDGEEHYIETGNISVDRSTRAVANAAALTSPKLDTQPSPDTKSSYVPTHAQAADGSWYAIPYEYTPKTKEQIAIDAKKDATYIKAREGNPLWWGGKRKRRRTNKRKKTKSRRRRNARTRRR